MMQWRLPLTHAATRRMRIAGWLQEKLENMQKSRKLSKHAQAHLNSPQPKPHKSLLKSRKKKKEILEEIKSQLVRQAGRLAGWQEEPGKQLKKYKHLEVVRAASTPWPREHKDQLSNAANCKTSKLSHEVRTWRNRLEIAADIWRSSRRAMNCEEIRIKLLKDDRSGLQKYIVNWKN